MDDIRDFDVVIIGAGIVGAMVARELSRYELRILLLDREADLGMGASSANSAILHAGYDPAPGTLKARLNVAGNKAWDSLCPELDIPFRRTGSYVVAIGEEELPPVERMFQQGMDNGVPGLKLIRREEMLTREPLINRRVAGALYAPTAGVIDPFQAVLASAECAVLNGAQVRLNCRVQGFQRDGDRITAVMTNQGPFRCRFAINCAGAGAAQVLDQALPGTGMSIRLRRGEYFIYDCNEIVINNILFPTPSAKGKGVLVSTTTHGNVMIGPNSAPVEAETDRGTTPEGLEEIVSVARRLVPVIGNRGVIASYAGLRACGHPNEDFQIQAPAEAKGFINVFGINSPGFVSAPAIATMVADLLREEGLPFLPRRSFRPERPAPPRYHLLSHREKAELIAREPAYGRIVCRCEEITEGEILAACRGPIPATTYDAVKRRTWLGTGRCQGAFDYPRVLEILARELGVPITEVTKSGPGSEFIVRATKDVEVGHGAM
jgi:glycerol-3-phosphate dehydrogenase